MLAAACSAKSTSAGSTGSGSGSSSGGNPVACDPLAPPPTALTDVLGVGQDAQGTLYVADSPAGSSQPRVLVSAGTQLVRQSISGSGEAPGAAANTTEYTLSFQSPGSDESTARSLLLDVTGGSATAMGLGPAASKEFLGDAGADVTRLTLVDPGTVSGLTVVNLPGVVGYVADVSDGTAIVITSPGDVESSADLHLFYGTPDAMVERTIISFNQALSGYPTIVFTVGAATYTMSISGTFPGGPGPGTLNTGSANLSFTLRDPPPATLSGFSFTCLGG